MDLAIRKAKEVGIAWVNSTGELAKEGPLLRWCALCVDDVSFASCSGSNHYGIAGWYAIRAAKEGLIVSKRRCVCVFVHACVYVYV